MQTAKIYGSSDDLILVEGVKGADEFNVYGNDHSPHMASLNLGGKMRIHAIYDGCWSFAVGQVDEDIPLPEWPVKISGQGYSTIVEISVPDDVKVFLEKRS